MTRKEVVSFLTYEKDLDLAQLVKDVEQERKAKEDNDRTLWLADVEETEKFLLQSLLDYIETIFGVALTKEEEKDFRDGVKRMRGFSQGFCKDAVIYSIFFYLYKDNDDGNEKWSRVGGAPNLPI